jgi:hypothetical protein
MERDVEMWENHSNGKVWVWKIDQRTGGMRDEIVASGMKFSIKNDDRVMNQEMAASEEMDIFKNGTLMPVRLIDQEEAKELASNPNFISESEMRDLFTGHWKTFETKVASITNAGVLERMLAISGEVDAKVRQVEVLKARLHELNPIPVVERETVREPVGGAIRQRPVTS